MYTENDKLFNVSVGPNLNNYKHLKNVNLSKFWLTHNNDLWFKLLPNWVLQFFTVNSCYAILFSDSYFTAGLKKNNVATLTPQSQPMPKWQLVKVKKTV